MNRINLTNLSKLLSISPKAVERLVGSTKISSEGQEYDLGLRIEPRFLDPEILPGGFSEEAITKLCKEYSATCPAVYNWICSGDFQEGEFSAESIRIHMNNGLIVHACRTAGRLRAELFKKKA